MPQTLLPLIPEGATEINDRVSVVQKDGYWTWFVGILPICRHAANDERSFLVQAAQLCSNGVCLQADIIRAFGVSKNKMIRATAKVRAEGPAGFYKKRRGRGTSVVTQSVAEEVQRRLDRGALLKDIATAVGVDYDTLRKARDRGQIRTRDLGTGTSSSPQEQETCAVETTAVAVRDTTAPVVVTDKSTRSDLDAAAGAGMGIACTRVCERVLAAVGQLPGGATSRFEHCRDVTCAGALVAVPALVANGLFLYLSELPEVAGLYTTLHVMLCLAFMALCRIKAVEELQHQPVGELGKLMGLDRVPEVSCLREKLKALSLNNVPERWAAQLSGYWMRENPELAGFLCVDAHVRLYHGAMTELPRRYVSRQRLCLRGTTAYYVNDVLGGPFFCVERPIDQGLLEVLETEVVPRLLRDVPNQPTGEQLESDPTLFRFVLIFDREGYSPSFMRRMWVTFRIACITYHKHPKEDWPESWFEAMKVTMPGGAVIEMKLAEMGTWVGGSKDGVWVREVRKLTESGHQTSLISTAYRVAGPETGARLFSRWSQENFFRYMMQHFAIDALNEYRTEEIPGTNRPVVNPTYRELDRATRSLKAKLTQRQARFAALSLRSEAEEPQILEWERKKAALREEIEHLDVELAGLKAKIASTPKHLAWDELPEEAKFERLAPSRKILTDTVKLVAYRAETALASIVQEEMTHPKEARSLVRELLRSHADLCPDERAGVLTVRLHTLSTPRDNRAAQHLLDYLNATDTTYPGTTMKLVYTLSDGSRNGQVVPSQFPPGKEI